MPFEPAAGGFRPDVTQPIEPVSTKDVLGAAFRQDNTVVSIINAAANSGPFTPDPSHNPLDLIRGTSYEANHLDRFMGSRSEAETRAIMGEIDQEDHDRRVLDAAGFGGTLLQMLAGTLDPTIFLPAGAVAKAGREGYSLARSALSVGLATAGQAATQEAILQGTQETRPLAQSALAVGSATILGSILGAGAARLLTSAERKVLEEALDKDRAAITAHAATSGDNVVPFRPGEPTGETIGVPATEVASGEPSPALAASAGAAAADTRTLEPVGAFGLEKAPMDPTLRTLSQPSVAARRAYADLTELSVLTKDNLRGETSTSGGAPLESIYRTQNNSSQVLLRDKLKELWGDLRLNGAQLPTAALLRDRIGLLPGEGPTFEQFKEMVSDAMMAGDKHDIPQVAQAAQYVRAQTEPWVARAEAVIPEFKRETPKDGEGFFWHDWNKEKIAQRRPEFVDKLTDKYAADQQVKAGQKQQLEWLNAQHKSWDGQAKKFEARMERLQASQEKVAARLDERAMEVRRAEKRTDTLKERETEVADELNEIEAFIREAREDVKDPALLARIDQMEADAAALRKADRPATEADLRRIEGEEVKGVLTGTTRKAAEMLVGRRAYPKAPSFVTYLVTNGGVADAGGDVASMIGGKRVRPGLINAQGRSLDQWGEKLADEFPGAFPNGRPSPNEVLAFIDDAMRGHPPDWWVEHMSQADREALDAGRLATAMDEMFSRAGVEVKSVRDVGKLLRDGHMGDVTLADLDKIAAEMEAAGEAIPASLRRADAEEGLAAGRGELERLRSILSDAIASRQAAERKFGKATAVTDEAAFGARANRGRLGVLQDRLDRAEMRRELIADAIEMASKQRDEVRGKIEDIIGAWEGQSAAEAKSALKAREKYRTEAKAAGKEPGRLTGADAAVDTAVRRIIRSDRYLSRDELRSVAQETTDRILSSPDGRLPYDAGGKTGSTPGEALRGSLNRRLLDVSNEFARDWIERDVEEVFKRFNHTVMPDVLLAERFGDIEMSGAFRAVNEEYARLSDAAGSEAARKKLEAKRQRTIEDLAAVRDRLRGVYAIPSTASQRRIGRISQAVRNANVPLSMGASALSSIPDAAGTIFQWGLGSTLRDGWAPFLKSLMTGGKYSREAMREAKVAGIAIDTATAQRHHEFAGVADNYRPGSPLERTLQWGADKMQLINLLGPWTDLVKTISFTVNSVNLYRAAKAAAEGKATAKQLRELGASNISRDLYEKIVQEYEKSGTKVDGVLLPNTESWPRETREIFEAALARNANINVVTPGLDKPLFMSDATWAVLTQFKSFTAAATTRILIGNLQRGDAQTLQGLVASIALGMVAYKFNSISGGSPTSDKPADWIKEGISRGSILGWLEEGNALASKMTRGGVDIYRLVETDRPVSRYANRSALDQLLGPTFGKLTDLAKITGAAASGDWNGGDVHATRRAIVLQNLIYTRGLFNELERRIDRRFGFDVPPSLQ